MENESSVSPIAKQPKKDTRSRGGCARCRRRRQKCDQDKPSCGRCLEAGCPCSYEVNLSWGGRSFGKSAFGSCLKEVHRVDTTSDGNGFVYGLPSQLSTGSRRSFGSSVIQSPSKHDTRLSAASRRHTQNRSLNAPSQHLRNRGTPQTPSSDSTLAISRSSPDILPQNNVAQDSNFTKETIPQPQRQISLLPPMAQYLFQFYLSETMRLTVPSSYAKTEICRFIVPMSFREPSLLYAVMAFASVHLDAIGQLPGNSRRLIDSLHWASISHLRQLLDNCDPTAQAVALATTRTLCQAQIYGGTSLWRVHLDGARAILEASPIERDSSNSPRESDNTKFLASWFHNAEALASLSPTGLFGSQLPTSRRRESGVLFDIFGGVMSDLPSLFRAVGSLVRKKRMGTPDLESEAETLIQEIHRRLARDTAEEVCFKSDILSSLSANDMQNYALSNAGFLFTALLHIYSGVRSLSPLTLEVQLCVNQIIQCAHGMSCESGLSPKVLLVSPLFTAGLCATGFARDSIRAALVDIGKWMKTPHLSKTLGLLEKVWLEYPDDSARVWEGLESINVDFLPY